MPTLDEVGFAGLEITAWDGLVALPGTPAAVVDRLNREVNEILRDETVRAQLARLAFTPIGGTAVQFRALAAEERRK
jgi:tripartite-type tricarboxylate transporter receptor subunit TctC